MGRSRRGRQAFGPAAAHARTATAETAVTGLHLGNGRLLEANGNDDTTGYGEDAALVHLDVKKLGRIPDSGGRSSSSVSCRFGCH
ncbi:hypothetical protein QC334_06060 [Streptomyces sp. DH18]|uniref:hypothetical protein n=1 Tax=Streptomyces sp. DH18 TaxID=3040126 RepID=UPI0024423C94|nr:hypothetical protein [Streptomyces sp. DH18]MDG9682305.1 hypothetical protein [Streptomyces sp. DH18]